MLLSSRVRHLVVAAMLMAPGIGIPAKASDRLTLAADGWYTWQVPSVEYPSNEVLYVLIRAGTAKEIEVASQWCGHWRNNKIPHDHATDLGLLDTDRSIDWLLQFARPGSDLASDAVAAISRHAGERAFRILKGIVESDADPEFRQEAVFWMVVSESDIAFDYLDRLIMGTYFMPKFQ